MPRGRPKKNQGDMLVKSAEMIGWAIGGIEREIMSTRERLATLSAQAATLRAKLPGGGAIARGGASPGGATAETPNAKEKRRRRKMSPEARKRISEMMKKRWAERRKGK